jgi:hypothetical protein
MPRAEQHACPSQQPCPLHPSVMEMGLRALILDLVLDALAASDWATADLLLQEVER